MFSLLTVIRLMYICTNRIDINYIQEAILISQFVTKIISSLLPLKKIEDFVFIIGAQKGGTTSLHSYLEQHSKIISAKKKEVGFFSKDINYEKGMSYYYSQFAKNRFANKYAIDATTEYSYYPNVSERIYKHCPKAKIIILLREPIERAYSAFNMYKTLVGNKNFQFILESASVEMRSFYSHIANGDLIPDIKYFIDREMEIIHTGKNIEEPALIRRGLYSPQLKRYIKLFGKENVLILFSEDLRENTIDAVNLVFQFLDLQPLKNINLEHKHILDYCVDPIVREYITKNANHFFIEDRKQLIKEYELNVPW